MNNHKSLSFCTYFIVTIFASINLYFINHIFISWDISWLLEAARRFINGGSYSQNFFENNPPLIIYIYSIAAALGKLTSSKVMGFILLVYIIAFSSLYLSWSLLRNSRQLSFTTLNLILITQAFICFILGAGDFGQREHLALMLIFPYLWQQSLRLESTPLSLVLILSTGLLAAIGFSIKPHFVISWLLILMLVAYQKRTWKIVFYPENLVIFLFMLGYLIAVTIFNFDYFQIILPLVLHLYLNYWHPPFLSLILDPFTLIITASLTMGFLQSKKGNTQYVFQVLVTSGVGFLAIYFIQKQSWYYHLIPSFGLALMIIVLNIHTIIQKINRTQQHSFSSYLNLFISTALVSLAFSYIFMLSLAHISRHMDSTEPTHEVLNALMKLNQGPFMVISTSLEPSGTLLTYSGLDSGTRFPSWWLLPGALKLKESKQLTNQQIAKQALQLLRTMVIEDLKNNRPKVVLVDNNPEKKYLDNRPFDFIEFLEVDPQFQNQWRYYHPIEQKGHYMLYSRSN